jgi:hypothetical protein
MPTDRLPRRRQRRGRLHVDQEQEFWLGPGRSGTLFADDAERKALWVRHRDRLMELFGGHGHRPWAWWHYEAPALGLRFVFDRECSTLYEAKQLSASEEAELVAEWRRQFDRSLENDFFYTVGPGEILDGEDARAAHLEWAGIPTSLLEQWERERRTAA